MSETGCQPFVLRLWKCIDMPASASQTAHMSPCCREVFRCEFRTQRAHLEHAGPSGARAKTAARHVALKTQLWQFDASCAPAPADEFEMADMVANSCLGVSDTGLALDS